MGEIGGISKVSSITVCAKAEGPLLPTQISIRLYGGSPLILSSSLPLSVAETKMTAASSAASSVQPMSQPKEMNKKRAAVAVQFHPSIRIRPVPSLSFMSDEERGAIWYSVS